MATLVVFKIDRERIIDVIINIVFFVLQNNNLTFWPTSRVLKSIGHVRETTQIETY